MSGDARLIVDAFAFATHAHGTQKRDDRGDPYIAHLAEVAALCARHEPFDPVLVAGAVLHDTLEDTGVSEAELRERFGDEVTELVLEVTDPDGLKKSERRARQVAHMLTASDRARILKIADKTSNVGELADLPASRIKPKRMRKFVAWSRQVVANCKGVDAALEAGFEEAAARADARIASQAKEGKS